MNADLRLSDPIRYEELCRKGIDWMAKEIQKDEALHALCHVAALNFKKIIEEERQQALAGIMMPEKEIVQKFRTVARPKPKEFTL